MGGVLGMSSEMTKKNETKNEKIKEFKDKKKELKAEFNKLRGEDWKTISAEFNEYIPNHIETIEKLIDELTSFEELHVLNSLESRINFIIKALNKFKDIEKVRSEDDKREILNYPTRISSDIYACLTFLNQYKSIKDSFSGMIQNPLLNTIKDVEQELNQFRRLRNISDNALTEEIYNNAVEKYNKLEDKYRTYFYKCLIILFGVTFFLFLLKSCIQSIWGISTLEFWFLKITILTVGITLISYFLKQSLHYQRLADQNYQTQVELQAYPTFMESIPTNEAASVRKELALKYFGREIDGAAHKDMSNLISDQMKSTTEMVKAATDVLKVKG